MMYSSLYICPTWVNITWEKCYFQNAVFTCRCIWYGECTSRQQAWNGGKRLTFNHLLNTLTPWNMTIGQWLRVKVDKDFLSRAAYRWKKGRDREEKRAVTDVVGLEWTNTPCMNDGMSGRGIKSVRYEWQHGDNDMSETKQTATGC